VVGFAGFDAAGRAVTGASGGLPVGLGTAAADPVATIGLAGGRGVACEAAAGAPVVGCFGVVGRTNGFDAPLGGALMTPEEKKTDGMITHTHDHRNDTKLCGSRLSARHAVFLHSHVEALFFALFFSQYTKKYFFIAFEKKPLKKAPKMSFLSFFF
jgi:hypothetical protein